ncbi:uncharacterized protein Z519_09860 [Cladophialophora bantiana CBS 173.52]|uniref:TM7S3/TM198-like domain-containing protein n=1 Tax=Cladophialophora bantiana (strain ATCC 10958 / CBS 173.52 / CDC B-1940 / NIH 8579) TaxID=1442370 RepID=A0A0D2HYL0_CLAB1|nr:uncharacterized protein Z519_09860 [Cladophialophora bantiana CBS 173.52]KIW89704.1 hypothetical protein Z519_09860 [Cladophialophora bantiana CBS 173.52]
MRLSQLIVWTVLGWALPSGVCGQPGSNIQKRQDSTNTNLPSLTTDSPSASVDASTPVNNTVTSSLTTSTQTVQRTTSARSSPSSAPSSTAKHTSSTNLALPTASTNPASNSTTTSTDKEPDALPIQPRLTPAFGIAGVILIVLGSTYALIGVKTRWVQIFLSCAFLASIATTALVDYVMNPPVTDAVQGGFFVAIFMTGAVFGGGALVFKEVTEGFACLLGGFCFSMWLLTLRAGGLITSSGGKGAFIGIFCVVFWALSWTSYTRPYALIGSISFSGATAFTLGVDCFTRAGLKEFWFYIWNLNDNLFPLNTNTFPLTKGIRVEIAVIVICTIIGVLSQLKLWKVVRSKQREKGVVDEEDSRQREAVEAALGRHLQRQNERDKSEWEKQYGDRLTSKRNTVLWQDLHPEKRYSTVSVVSLEQAPKSGSSENVEMNAFGPQRASSAYGSKNKRQSTLTVDVIEEVEEDMDAVATKERQKALQALESSRNPFGTERKGSGESTAAQSTRSYLKDVHLHQDALKDQSGKPSGSSKLKRGSQQSLSRRSRHLSASYGGGGSESQEHLIDGERPQSRASSAAATMDVDNEELDVNALDVEPDPNTSLPPEIVISPAASSATDVPKRAENAARVPLEVPGILESTIDGNLQLEHILGDLDRLSANGASSSDEALKLEGGETKTELREVKKPHSQTSDTTNSSADTLTKTALAKVPSQLSSVVLSYRTNEWAKHITIADKPIYDEPETIEGIDDELPTQLAPVTTEPEKIPAEPPVEVPPAATLPPTVKAGGAGVGIASQPPSSQRSVSDQERRRSTGRVPSRSASTQSLKRSNSRGGRNSLNATMQNSLVATPIDEDAPMEFTSPERASRRVSSPYMMPQRSNSGTRPHTAYGGASALSVSMYDLPQVARPLSQNSNRPGISIGTRLDSYNSHQPNQRDRRSDAQKRESLLAEWRLSQQHRATSTSINGAMAEAGHAQLKAEKENQKLMEEYQRGMQERKQLAMDQAMRRPDMLELHREAMRKLQAGANKNMGSRKG